MINCPGDDFNDFRGVKHAYFDCIHANIVQYRLQLCLQNVGRHAVNCRHAQRVLGGNRRDRRHPKAAECSNRLQVRLNAGTAAAVRPRDGEHAYIAEGFIVTSGYERIFFHAENYRRNRSGIGEAQ